MRCTLPVLLLLATLTSCSCGAPPPLAATSGFLSDSATTPPQALAPFDYINGQLIDLDTGIKLYRLTGLKPSTGYEVRVSFPASIPATIKFALVRPPAAAAATAGRKGSLLLGRLGRRLLDCEKLIFDTDAQGAVQGIAQPHVELRAFRRSVHRDGPKAGAPQLVYNIVLAELIGGLPLDSIPTVVTIVLVVLVAFFWSLVWSNRLFPKVLDFLLAPDSSSSSRHAAGEGGKLSSSSSTGAPAATPAAATKTGPSKAASRGGHSKRSA